MTWASRAKLGIGVVVIVLLVAVFTVIFTQRQSEVTSASAEISAERYEVGTGYSGDIVTQDVTVGDRVTKGETLFTLSSPSMSPSVRAAATSADSDSYSIAADGTITFVATVAGTVSSVDAQAGSFVPAGSVLATIDRSGSLYVASDFVLTPRDYERIESGARVDLMLPDQTSVPGRVGQVTVQTVNGVARTRIRVTSTDLVEGGHSGLVSSGTPVAATLHLRQDGILAGPQDAVLEFLTKIGL